MTYIKVRRNINNELEKHLFEPEITVLIGPRQVGKTTLLSDLKEFLIQRGHSERMIEVFNLDLVTDRRLFSDQSVFIKHLRGKIEEDSKMLLYVFVDEAQRLPDSGVFFKGIYDLKLPIKLVLTGSSTLEIQSKTLEPLTGRKRLFHVFPFSFEEYLQAHEEELIGVLRAPGKTSEYDQEKLFSHLSDFMIYGGYPRVAIETNLEKKKIHLKEIYSSYIEKDVVGLLKIKDDEKFGNLVTLLAGQVGQLVNGNELCNTLNTTQQTLGKYLRALEETFIVRRIRPYFKNIRKELTKMPKFFFVDTGLRNFALSFFQEFNLREDRGALLENFVLNKLFFEVGEGKVHYWRTKDKNEVDFVFQSDQGKLIPIEVKAAALVKRSDPRGLRQFMKRYACRLAFVVNRKLEDHFFESGTTIHYTLPFTDLRIYSSVKSL